MAVVLDGLVHLTRADPAGRPLTTGLVGPGGLLGLAALRGAAAHDDRATALSRVRALELPAADLLAPGHTAPALLAAVADGLRARLDRAYATRAAAGEDAPTRLLALLRTLAAPAPAGAALAPLALRPTHAALARLLGADRATVTRALRALAAAGLARAERGHVVAVAPAGAAGWPR